MNSIHLGIRPYSCPHCSDTFSYATARRYHIQYKHNGIKASDRRRFRCSQCPRNESAAREIKGTHEWSSFKNQTFTSVHIALTSSPILHPDCHYASTPGTRYSEVLSYNEMLEEHWSAEPEQVNAVKKVFIDSLKQVEEAYVFKQEVECEETDIVDPPQLEDEKSPKGASHSVSPRSESPSDQAENWDPSELNIQRVILHVGDESKPALGGDAELERFSEEGDEIGSPKALSADEPKNYSSTKESRYRRSKRLEKSTLNLKQDPEFPNDSSISEDLEKSYFIGENSRGSDDEYSDEELKYPKRKSGTCTSRRPRLKRRKRAESGGEIYHVDAEGSIECLKCRNKFTVEVFFHHIKDIHRFDVVDVQCQDCTQVLTSQAEYILHRRAKHGPGRECLVCGKSIPASTTEMKKHLKTHNMHRCQYCGKEISDSSDHVEQEHGAEVGCPVCKEDIPEKILDGHVKAHSNPKQGCLKCGMHFDTNMGLKSHNREIHVGRPLEQCILCEKKFPGPWYLKQHMEESHNQEKNEVCKVCGDAFRHKRVLVNHMKLKHGKKTKCVVCNAPVVDSEWSKHMKGHEEGKQHTCKKCGETFIRATLLRSHMHMKHTPKVICTICGKEVHAVSLSLHLQKHSTVRSKCGQCGAEYKTERCLKVHMKSAHGVGGKKPLFLCQMCGKGFPERYQLKQHQLRHEEL
ncbi:unnamed protein product [Cyprideis torosa]|uniref:Uncharacterized protein n=1 Tax=Cyprideis torosa TaxID=163714 RepID=A0A7R8ZIN7_9CRUS|nr:unnamed protein product [Cyprideis torosa]CAG0886601.1 unnamed protein product [Cyprideis torosa]